MLPYSMLTYYVYLEVVVRTLQIFKTTSLLAMVVYAFDPSTLGRILPLGSEDFFEFETGLSYRMRPSLKRKKFFQGQKDGSAVKGSCCTSGGPEFGFQHPY